jgi:hypothetical protein
MSWQGNVKDEPAEVIRKATSAAGMAQLTPKESQPNHFKAEGGRSYNTVLLVILILFFLIPAILYYFVTPVNTLEVWVEKGATQGSSVRASAKGSKGASALGIFTSNLSLV